MAGVNEVQVSRYEDVIRGIFRITQPGAASPVVAAELLPAIVLESDRPEFMWVGKTIPFNGFCSPAAAVAANDRMQVALENPSGSRKIVVITAVTIFVADGANMGGSIRTTLASDVSGWTAGFMAPADTRAMEVPGALKGGISAECRLAPNNSAQASGLGVVRSFFASDWTRSKDNWLPNPQILSPGFALLTVLFAQAGGNTIEVAYSGYERYLEPSEKGAER